MKRFFFVLAVVVILLSGCMPVYMSAKKLPVDFNSVEKIEIYSSVSDKVLISTVEDEDSLDSVCSILEHVEDSQILAEPSCPYGLILVITDIIGSYTLSLSTDGCGIIKYNNEYYSSFSERKIRELIEEITGESFDIFLN